MPKILPDCRVILAAPLAVAVKESPALSQWATKVLLGGPVGPYIVSGLWGMVSLSPA